jgi:hypothetical protein
MIDLIDEALKLAQAQGRATLVYLLGLAADEARREPDAMPNPPMHWPVCFFYHLRGAISV